MPVLFFFGFLVSLSSSLPLFSKNERKALVPVLCVSFSCGLLYSLSVLAFLLSPLLCVPLVALASVGSGGRGCNRGLEEDDDEGAVAGQNLLSPLYNLPPRFCDFFVASPLVYWVFLSGIFSL
uniref:Uncharacterized protein n=1 Tax=Populus davidiana TaxID=266767 RepID=A0A6M2EET2_9ROSI